jgi:uncharacterized protein YigE (DUF2233 family)
VAVPTALAALLVVGTMEPALAAPGTDPFAARGAEWARDAGLGFLVTGAERMAYQVDKPTEGGTLKDGIPSVGAPAGDGPAGSPLGLVTPHASPSHSAESPSASSTASATPGAAAASTTKPSPSKAAAPSRLKLAPIPARVTPALAGEGRWQDAFASGGRIVARAAFVRPDATHTGYSVAVVAMDAAALTFNLHQGTQVPGGPTLTSPNLAGAELKAALATFNSGFLMKDANGGYWQNGTSVVGLRTGAASMVFGTDGTLRVQSWPGGTPGKGVAAVRQNLAMLVENGQVNPLVNTTDEPTEEATWGYTVGVSAYVWRSAVGTRSDGTVVFALGPALNVATLASLMSDAGCTNAMELDINSTWTSYITYAGGVPHKLTPDQHPAADRYLSPSTRDFVAVLPR